MGDLRDVEVGAAFPGWTGESAGRIARLRRSRKVQDGTPYRILFVSSTGGHLAQLLRLRPWWKDHDRLWVTFENQHALSALQGERVVWGYHPTTRNVKNLVRNLLLAARVLRREKPDLVVSNGAGVAVPFFWLAKLAGSRTVFLEVYDRIDSKTMTGKLVHPVTDLFLVQWEEQMRLYEGSVLVGALY